MNNYIVIKTVDDTDVNKYPGAKVVDWINGWYIIHVPTINNTKVVD